MHRFTYIRTLRAPFDLLLALINTVRMPMPLPIIIPLSPAFERRPFPLTTCHTHVVVALIPGHLTGQTRLRGRRRRVPSDYRRARHTNRTSKRRRLRRDGTLHHWVCCCQANEHHATTLSLWLPCKNHQACREWLRSVVECCGQLEAGCVERPAWPLNINPTNTPRTG